VADITPTLIAECRATLARGEDTYRSNHTVILYFGALSHAFTIAMQEWQWCDDNPARKITKPKVPRGRVRFLSDQERHQLLEALLASRNPYLHTLVVLVLATGARRGELQGLR
jgi:integrase